MKFYFIEATNIGYKKKPNGRVKFFISILNLRLLAIKLKNMVKKKICKWSKTKKRDF